jgi:single-strand DNA-binding protein
MLNSVNLQGRLAESPELRYTQGGVPVVRFGLAVEGTSKDAPADFFTIVCWREQAEFVARYLTKGRQVIVEGRLTTNKWTDKNGCKRKDVEVTAHRVHFAGNKEQQDPGYQAPPENYEDVPPDFDVPPEFMGGGY